MAGRSANGANGASTVSDLESRLRRTLAAQKQTIEELTQEKVMIRADLGGEIRALTAEIKAINQEIGGGATKNDFTSKNQIAILKHEVAVSASELSRAEEELYKTEQCLFQTQDENGHLKVLLVEANVRIALYEAKMGVCLIKKQRVHPCRGELYCFCFCFCSCSYCRE